MFKGAMGLLSEMALCPKLLGLVLIAGGLDLEPGSFPVFQLSPEKVSPFCRGVNSSKQVVEKNVEALPEALQGHWGLQNLQNPEYLAPDMGGAPKVDTTPHHMGDFRLVWTSGSWHVVKFPSSKAARSVATAGRASTASRRIRCA